MVHHPKPHFCDPFLEGAQRAELMVLQNGTPCVWARLWILLKFTSYFYYGVKGMSLGEGPTRLYNFEVVTFDDVLFHCPYCGYNIVLCVVREWQAYDESKRCPFVRSRHSKSAKHRVDGCKVPKTFINCRRKLGVH